MCQYLIFKRLYYAKTPSPQTFEIDTIYICVMMVVLLCYCVNPEQHVLCSLLMLQQLHYINIDLYIIGFVKCKPCRP